MVIERNRTGNAAAVGERFRAHGRMLPEGVVYLASWVELSEGRCFQVMEAERREEIDLWISRWEDLVEFEVVEVLTSAEFWKKRSTADERR